MIGKERLLEIRAELTQRRDQAMADYNAYIGALQLVARLIVECDADPTKQTDSSKKKG